MVSRPAGARKRAGWSFLDQVVWSLTNFLMSLIVLRSVGLTDFGAFTVAFTTYQIAVRVLRALVCEPLAIRFSATDGESWHRAAASATGAAIGLGGVVGAGVSLIALAVGGPVRGPLLLVGAALPGLLLQDAWRYAFFAGAAPARALVNDLIWGGTLLVLMTVALVGRQRGLTVLMGAWAASGAIAGAAGIVQAGLVPRLRRSGAWVAGHRDLGLRFLAEIALIGSAGPMALYLIGLLAGLEAVGALNAAVVLLGPISFMAVFVEILGIPEGVRLLQRSPSRLRTVVLRSGPVLFAIGMGIGGLIMLIPTSVGVAVFPDTWVGASRYLPYAALLLSAALWGQAGRVGLRALADARRTLVAQTIIAPLIVAAAAVGAWVGGGETAAAGWAAANVVGIVVWTRQFQGSYRSRTASDTVKATG